jgi:hypothetical protein
MNIKVTLYLYLLLFTVNVRSHLKIAGLSAAGLGIISFTGLKLTQRNPNGEKGYVSAENL